MQLDCAVVRLFLSRPPRMTAEDLTRDLVVYADPGALALAAFYLALRVNRRSRRSIDDLTKALSLQRRPRWATLFVKHLFSMYRLCLVHAPSNAPTISCFGYPQR
jgi:hypothetical protein